MFGTQVVAFAAITAAAVVAAISLSAVYPAEYASVVQAQFAPRVSAILKGTDRSFASIVASFHHATAMLETLGTVEFAKARSEFVARSAAEFIETGIGNGFATVTESTHGSLVARLPQMSLDYKANISISGWAPGATRPSPIAPDSRPNDTPVAYYLHVGDTTPRSVPGLDVYTEPKRSAAVTRSKVLNAASVTEPNGISTSGLPSVQLYGAVYQSTVDPATGDVISAPACSSVNTSVHPFLGWGIVPVTMTTLLDKQLGSEVKSESLIGVGEDVTDEPEFAWATASIERDNPCGARLVLPGAVDDQQADPDASLVLSKFHHALPLCREGKALFILENGNSLANSFSAIAKRCTEIRTYIKGLQAEGVTTTSEGPGIERAATHMGLVVYFGGRLWSITVTTTPEWRVQHPGPAFPLWARLVVVLVIAVAVAASVYTCTERQKTAMRTEEARRRAIHKRAAAANEAHSSTLSYVAHEVRNPAHVQLATAELMQDYVTEAAESASAETLADPALDGLFEMLQKDAETLRSTSQVTVRLVSDLLDLTKLKSGRLSVVLRGNPVSSMLAEAVERHAAMADPAVRISWRIGSGVPQHVLSDGLRIAQVLNNGLSNAVKFCRHGTITVTASLEWRYAPRSFYKQLSKSERRALLRQQERAARPGGCFGTPAVSGVAGRSRLLSSGSHAGVPQLGQPTESDHDSDGGEDDISADPLGIIDVDGSGHVPNVVSYLPLSSGHPVAPARRPVQSGGTNVAAGQSAFAHMPSIIESSLGGAALRVTGDLPLNATAAPSPFLDDFDPGIWVPGRLGDTVADSAVSGRPTRLQVAPTTARGRSRQRGDATVAVSSLPGSRHAPRPATTAAERSTASTASGRRVSLTAGGIAPLVEGDVSAQEHVPAVDVDAAKTTARLQSVRRLRFVDPATGATYAPGSAAPAVYGSPAGSTGRPLSVEGAAAAAAAAGGPASVPGLMVTTAPGVASATPAQGSPDPVVPPGMGVEDLGFHVLSLPRGGRVYAPEPRGPAPAGSETRSLVSAMSGDSDGVARWLRRPEAGACPLVPFQADDGRWAMPLVVLRVVNTGMGLNGKTMRELFAPYSSGADDDRSRSSHNSEKRQRTTGGRKRRREAAVATASRNAQATAAPTEHTMVPCDGESQSSQASVEDEGPSDAPGPAAGSQSKQGGKGGQSFAARVRSTGLGLGIAARLAFSMGATIRLFDAERDAMERVTACAGVDPHCAQAVVSEGFADSEDEPEDQTEADGHVVTVFEFALPVCPPGRLPRSLDDIPDNAASAEAMASPTAEEARRPEFTRSASAAGSGVAGAQARRGRFSVVSSLPVCGGGRNERTGTPFLVTRLGSDDRCVHDLRAHSGSDGGVAGGTGGSQSGAESPRTLPPIRASRRRRQDESVVAVTSGGSRRAVGLPDAVSLEPGSHEADSPSAEGGATKGGAAKRPKRSRAERAARRAKRDAERAHKDEARDGGDLTAAAEPAADSADSGGGGSFPFVASPKSAVVDAMRSAEALKPPLPPTTPPRDRDRGGERGAGHAVKRSRGSAAEAASAPTRSRHLSARPKRLPPMRVLLVDDDTSVREITARMLRRLGCSVDVLTDGVYVEPFLKKSGALASATAGPGFSMMAGTRSVSPTASSHNGPGDVTGSASAAPRASAGSSNTASPGPASRSESVADGASAARGRAYDVIFLDIIMPRLSGDAVCRRLVGHYGLRTPVFACSGNALPVDLERYRACGFSGVAAKPFSLAALKAKLFEVAAAKEARATGMALAAGKPVPHDLAAVMGSGPAHSFLAETELFAGAISHVLRGGVP